MFKLPRKQKTFTVIRGNSGDLAIWLGFIYDKEALNLMRRYKTHIDKMVTKLEKKQPAGIFMALPLYTVEVDYSILPGKTYIHVYPKI